LRCAALILILHLMGGSAEAPTLPDGQPGNGLRASDAERNEVVVKLTEEYAAGRLSHETFLFRMDAVLNARHQEDLPRLLADLPAPPASGQAPPAPGGPRQPAQGGPPAAGRESLGRRLRALLRPGGTQPGDRSPRTPAPRARIRARGLTGAMPGADSRARRPAPLQFPRGEGTVFSIGRDAGCDLAISDMTVSRTHARLERTQDGWLLTDMASTNGTRVNGWLVRDRVPVRAGDLVSFGKAEYWLSAADGN
jgi:hypothetical protein